MEKDYTEDYTEDYTPINKPELDQNLIHNALNHELNSPDSHDNLADLSDSLNDLPEPSESHEAQLPALSSSEEDWPFVAVDLSEIRASKSTSKSTRGNRTKAAVTIVNTAKHGKRTHLSKELVDKLDRPATVQVGFGEGQLIIGTNFLPDDSPRYKISFSEKSGANIYAGDLVGEITDEFNLDFTGITSISFAKVAYTKSTNCTVAIVEMI